jgi:sortase (surface protein transpeptidase)
MFKVRRYAVGVALVAALAACSHPAAQLSPPDATSPPTTSTAAPEVPSSAASVYPKAIRIPSIKVNSGEFMNVGLNPDKTMEEPPLTFPKLIAWYKKSAVPGENGPSIILSHINGNGVPGGFAKLDSVKVGDEVEVDRTDNQVAVFKVVDTKLYPKADYPKWAAKVFGDTPTPTLRLITCSGDLGPAPIFYKSNRVVSADLVRLEPKGR